MQVCPGTPPLALTADAYFAASVRAAAVWSYPALVGTDIRLSMVAAQDSAGVGYDKKNVIIFRQETWCRQSPRRNDAGVLEDYCYPASALAITSIVKNSSTGEILDTDIEFNAVDYSWGDLVARPDLTSPTTGDFQNALTHELGHVLGLDHNCYTPSDAHPRLKDNTGAPAVDCYNNPTLTDTVADATMYPSIALGDTMRRTLSPDDELGICDIYPHQHDVCPPRPSEGGCSVLATPSPDGGQTTMLWTAAGLLMAALAFLRVRLKV
jgi:hypothetical protein